MTKRPLPSYSMDVREVAQYFNASVSTVWRWEKTGIIPKSFKIGGLTRWRRSEIEGVTAGNSVAA